MRNLKKILALVLALVMSFSVMNVASATKYADITDKDAITDAYELAIELLVDMHVLTGYADNTFKPEGNITRAEMAALIYRITTGDVEGKQVGMYKEIADFTDTQGHWASSYIGYCAVKSYIKGYALGNGKYEFRPDGNITGIEALIMVLRAIGYNKTDVFSGSNWKVTALSYGQENGITKDITSYALIGTATREVVAMMIFNALNAATVSWTPAGGYTPYVNAFVGTTKNETLGQMWFDLTGPSIQEKDIWGRPQKVWTYNTGEKKTIHAIDYSYRSLVAVDECDIVYALTGENTVDYAIESSWIDGTEYDGSKTTLPVGMATTDGTTKIEALQTKSFLGGQGTVLEVYDLGVAGLRIIEINNYLGEVVKVTKATTDKNGHKTPASVTVDVFYGDAHDVADHELLVINKCDAYEKGDFVLVTVKNAEQVDAKGESIAYIADHDEATRVAGGTLTDVDKEKAAANEFGEIIISEPGIHTFNYNTDKVEADTFALNYNSEKDVAWDLLLDKEGNLIGLTESEVSYLAIERVEWQHKSGAIGGGYALADVILSNGEEVNNVIISSVNGEDVTVDDNDLEISITDAILSDDYTNNGVWSQHIVSYAIEADGSYALITHEDDEFVTDDAAAYVKGAAKLTGADDNDFVVNSKSVFLFWDEDEMTFTKYVGKNNIPSFEAAQVCVLENENDVIRLAIVVGAEFPSNTFLAFLGDADIDVEAKKVKTDAGFVKMDGHNFIKMGETKKTMYWTGIEDEDAVVDTFEAPGMYQITVDNDGVIEEIELIAAFFGASVEKEVGDLEIEEEFGLFLGWNKDLDGTTLQLQAHDADEIFENEDKAAFDPEEDGYYVVTETEGLDVHEYDEAELFTVTVEADGTATLKAGADDVEEKILLVIHDDEFVAQYVFVVEYDGYEVEAEEEEEDEPAEVEVDINANTEEGIANIIENFPGVELTEQQLAYVASKYEGVNVTIDDNNIVTVTGTLPTIDFLAAELDGSNNYKNFIFMNFVAPVAEDGTEATKAAWNTDDDAAMTELDDGVFLFVLCVNKDSVEQGQLFRTIYFDNGEELDLLIDLTGVKGVTYEP